MLALFTDLANPMAELRHLGIDAAVAWHADMDGDAQVLIEPDAKKLDRLARWLGARA